MKLLSSTNENEVQDVNLAPYYVTADHNLISLHNHTAAMNIHYNHQSVEVQLVSMHHTTLHWYCPELTSFALVLDLTNSFAVVLDSRVKQPPLL